MEVTGGIGSATNSATISIAPESLAPTNITAQSSGSSLIISWPTNYIGWRLETQTNGLGSSAGWSTLTGSDETNVWTFPFNQATPCVFFRLVYPGN